MSVDLEKNACVTPSRPTHVAPQRVPLLLLPVVAALVPWFPRWLGPHLARSSWWRAIAVSIGSVALAMGIGWTSAARTSFADLLHPLDLLARGVIGLLLMSPMLGPYAAVRTWLVGIGIAVAWVLFALLFSVLFWPLLHVGEKRRLLAARCAKLTLWSAPTLVWIVVLLPRMLNALPTGRFAEESVVFLLLLALCWYISVMVRLGGRYSGPADGIRWQPYDLLCEACGYHLITLADDDRCPECGIVVRQSLPEARTLPAFAARRGLQRIPGFVRTFFAVLTPRFGARCKVWSGRRASGWFLFLCCVFTAIGVTLLGAYYAMWSPEMQATYQPRHLLALGALGLLAGLGLWSATAVLRWLIYLRSPARALRQQVVLNYLSACGLWSVLIGGGVFVVMFPWIEVNRPWPWFHVPGVGPMHSEVLLMLLSLAPGLGLGLLSLSHIWRQLSRVQRANG